MRIAFLSFEFPPDHGGGLSTYMSHTLRMLKKHGVEAFVVVPDASIDHPRITTYEGAHVYRFSIWQNPARQHLGHWDSISYGASEALVRAINLFGMPDIVETCDGFGMGYFSLQRKLTLEAPFKDLKFLVTAHTPVMLHDQWSGQRNYALPNYWTRQTEIFSFKAADLVISPSRFLIGELRTDFECGDVAFSHVPNPYERPDPAEPAQSERLTEVAEQGSRDGAPHCIMASRIQHWKGVLHAIAGFERHWQEGGDLAFRIYGGDTKSELHDGSLTDFIRRRFSRSIESGRLRLEGLVPPNRLEVARQHAVAQIHPSLKENFPYTVIEQMARGGLVAASCAGGQAELIVDGVSGFLFDPHSPASIAASLQRLTSLTDSQKRQAGEIASCKIRDVCSYDRVWARKAQVLEQAISPRRHFPFLRGASQTFGCPPSKVERSAPRLSVVIPHYNLGSFLVETVDSVLSSTFRDLEVVIVDDGSTDLASLETLKTIEQGYPKQIRILRKANSGVADTRNHGVKHARGEYIALLDADDLVQPSYYGRCIEVLDHYANVGFVGCWNEDFNQNGTIRLWPTFNPEPHLQLVFNTVNCQGTVVRKEAFLKHGQHDPALNMFLDDWESTIGLLCAGVRGVMIPHPLFRYRNRAGSIFQSRGGLWHANYERIVRKHLDSFRDQAQDIILFLNQNGPNTQYHNPTFGSAFSGTTMYRDDNRKLVRLARRYYEFRKRNRVMRWLRDVLR